VCNEFRVRLSTDWSNPFHKFVRSPTSNIVAVEMEGKGQSTVLGAKEEKKKSAKPKVRFNAQEASTDANEDLPTRKSSKKRKAKDVDELEADVESDSSKAAVDNVSRKKSKKRKQAAKSTDVSGFPDPSEDSSLSEKAQNALSNALLRIVFPDLWKFNKGTQNWLMKNFWAPDAVPEKYVPIVVGYLAGCEGGIRAKLIDNCKKHSQPPSDDEAAEKPVLKGILKKDEPPKADSSIRAAVLLKALS